MDNMTRFVETLGELMVDAGVCYEDVEKATGCSAGNISMWLCGRVQPTVPALIRLSQFFGCSIDYLIGRSDTLKFDGFEIVSSLSERLRELARERKKTLTKIARELLVDESILYRWQRGTVKPNLNNLIMLADYFSCTTDFLVGRR